MMSRRFRSFVALVVLAMVGVLAPAPANSGSARAQPQRDPSARPGEDSERPEFARAPSDATESTSPTRRAVFVRTAFAIEPSFPTLGVAARGVVEARFRRPIALRARLWQSGIARHEASGPGADLPAGTIGLGALELGVGYAAKLIAVYAGGGVGRIARETESRITTFGAGAFGAVGARFGRLDDVGIDLDLALGSSRDAVGSPRIVPDVALTLRIPMRNHGMLGLRTSFGTMTPILATASAEARVMVRGTGGPRSAFMTARLGWQWLAPYGASSDSYVSGYTFALGAELRYGSVAVADELLAPHEFSGDPANAGARTGDPESTRIEALERRGRRLRRTGIAMLVLGSLNAATGAALMSIPPSDTGQPFVAGAYVAGIGGGLPWITAGVLMRVGRRKQERAAAMRGVIFLP